MAQLHTGIDLIEIERIAEALQRHGERFLERIYTPAELAECRHESAIFTASLAARFAAKEAAAKALGTGIGSIAWQEIEILHAPSGQPFLNLLGAAERQASELGLTTWSLSLSHTHTHAVAVVVAVGP
jgi:holo-[acyl-carrier protein] synthase